MRETWSFVLNNQTLSDTKCITSITRALIVLLLTSVAASQTLTGTIGNTTTGKPAAGDEVVVFSLSQGMKESGRTTTNARGQFRLELDNTQTRHLVRAIHQGITYHQIAPPGSTSVNIDVYDVAQKVKGIVVVADIMRIQAANGQIVVTRNFGVRNASTPPVIQMNERNLEFYIPDGARLIENSGMALTEEGAPMKSSPMKEGEKNRYSFGFPLRPGLTLFEVSYQLPYSGSAKLDPRLISPVENFMVLLPKSMRFKAASGSTGFKAIESPKAPDAVMQLVSKTTKQQALAFNISGEGTLKTSPYSAIPGSNQVEERSTAIAPDAHSDSRASGRLSPAVAASGLLQVYRWWILSGLAAILLIAGVCLAWRQQAATRAFVPKKIGSSSVDVTREDSDYGLSEKNIPGATYGTVTPTSPELMGQIKSQLFKIELERKNGKISQAEFEKAWTALDEMLGNVLKGEAHRA